MTELTWDGKYNGGKKQGPVRVVLPFQTIETVNESLQERQRSLELFSTGRESQWRNRLIWGDKKYVLPSLLPEFAAKVNLIYIDPPFDTGADFSFTATIPNHVATEDLEDASFTKEPSILEQKAYRDTWGRGLDSYLIWFYETVTFLHELLHETGTLYVHLDWHVSFYAKAILDEIFGAERFVNEIVWKRQTAKGDVTQGAMHMGRIHESIFVYTKSEDYTWNMQYVPYDEKYLETHYRNIEPGTNRRFELDNLIGPGGAAKGNPNYEVMGVRRFWRYKRERMEELHKAGRIVQPSPGAVPRYKRYLDEMPGLPLQDVWTDINAINSQAIEAAGYATQKPEALLSRILKLSSNENDLVFDCFVGSGTTAAVAEKLNRRWTICDLSRFAIHTARKRLLNIPNLKPFAVQNLGKYERQAWQAAEFSVDGKDHREEQRQREAGYRQFILDLYRAKSLSGQAWLHGIRGGRAVHVGAVDAPVTLADVKAISKEAWRALGTGKDAPTKAAVDILGWEFAFEINELAKQVAAESRVDVAFKKIPREVLDKKAVEQGDVRFFELGALSVDTKQTGLELSLKLKDFLIPTDDIPDEARKAIKHWSQLIDYWAVDWDYKDDTFHNQWQTYRTKTEPKMEVEAHYKYAEPGKYAVVVKVIDILGNDTTKTLEVAVKEKR
jgi:adenine-specific DNA-methyltransferase